MNCPNCGAPLHRPDGQDYLSCGHCGGIHFPEPNADGVTVLGDRSELNGPGCGDPLVSAKVTGMPVLHCERCRGLLIEMDSFVEMIHRLIADGQAAALSPRPINAADLERATDCPGCGRRMDTHPYGGGGGVVLDNCPRCRFNWLDHKELRRVVSAAAAAQRGAGATGSYS